jgi:DNA phosphorothioation-dependent restriction protein DptG
MATGIIIATLRSFYPFLSNIYNRNINQINKAKKYHALNLINIHLINNILDSTQWVDEVNNISYRTTTVIILVVSIISQLALLFKHFDDY